MALQPLGVQRRYIYIYIHQPYFTFTFLLASLFRVHDGINPFPSESGMSENCFPFNRALIIQNSPHDTTTHPPDFFLEERLTWPCGWGGRFSGRDVCGSSTRTIQEATASPNPPSPHRSHRPPPPFYSSNTSRRNTCFRLPTKSTIINPLNFFHAA